MISSLSSSSLASQIFSKLDSKSQGYLEKSDLTSAFSQISSSNSSSTENDIDQLFSAMDSDGDGKVTFAEAQSYDQSSKNSSSSSTDTSSTSSSSSSNSDAAVMMKIMQLVHAYGNFGDQSQQSSLLSVSA